MSCHYNYSLVIMMTRAYNDVDIGIDVGINVGIDAGDENDRKKNVGGGNGESTERGILDSLFNEKKCDDTRLRQLEMKSVLLDTYISENPRDIHVKDRRTWILLRLVSLMDQFQTRLRDSVSGIGSLPEIKKKQCLRELVDDGVMFHQDKKLVLEMLDNGVLEHVFTITGKFADGEILKDDVSEMEYGLENDGAMKMEMVDVLLDEEKPKPQSQSGLEINEGGIFQKMKMNMISVWKTITGCLYKYIYAC